MPLNPAELQSQLYDLCTSKKPQTAVAAANAWADAYRAYASKGQAGGAFPQIAPGVASAAMAVPLVGAFSMPTGIPSIVASALGAMVSAYWTGATYLTAPPGTVLTPPLLLPALIQGSTVLMLNKNNSAEIFAAQLALLLDTCTRSVLVTVPLAPTPYTLPIV